MTMFASSDDIGLPKVTLITSISETNMVMKIESGYAKENVTNVKLILLKYFSISNTTLTFTIQERTRR